MSDSPGVPSLGWRAECFQVVGVALLTFYGVEVCPFLDNLELAELGWILGASFLLLMPTRRALLARLEEAEAAALEADRVRWPWRHGLLDFSTWVGAGLLMTAWNRWYYGFPVVISGLKLVSGATLLGLFAGADALLGRQARTIAWYAAHPGRAAQAEGPRVPLARQLLVFSSTLLVVTSIALVLLFKKDTGVLIQAARQGQGMRFHQLVTLEVAFVTAVLLAAGVVLARRFGANLQAMFELELRSLQAVDQGRYDVPVPLVSNDEFRAVAASTNQMLVGLAERDRIRATFGRYVSPAVAQAILEHEGGAELGGRQVDVAVLFSDLRNFTPLSERLAPRELVAFLNEYFAEMVEELHAAGGVVDKFIGDAVMAVFGLEGREDPCGRALDAALGMQARVEELNARLEARGLPAVACGVGIHYGPVIAGNIGSPERLEYTVIGDSVNVAARLESKTKELGVGVAVSAEVRARLDAGRRQALRDLGAQELKGKSAAVEVFGV